MAKQLKQEVEAKENLEEKRSPGRSGSLRVMASWCFLGFLLITVIITIIQHVW